jgi:hypothetical protein
MQHAEWLYRLKCTDIHFCADDGAQSLEFMPVASNGIKALPLFIRLRQGVASRATGTSCLGAARFSKLRGRLHGLLDGAREDLTWMRAG